MQYSYINEKDHRILTTNHFVQINDLEKPSDMTAKLVDSLDFKNPLYIGTFP